MTTENTNRIAGALERIAAALERPYPQFNPGGYIKPPWEITSSDAPTVSIDARDLLAVEPLTGGDDHRIGTTLPDPTTVTQCTATTPGHWCTRREHADDRHVWAMSDEAAQRILRAAQELGFVAEADPLDESDHRPRHLPDGEIPRWREDCGRWHVMRPLEWQGEALTFCDCPDPVVTEAENGATD